MNLSEVKLLITGGGRGIGNFLGLELLNKVAKVILVDKDDILLNDLPSNDNLVKICCDLTDHIAVEKLIARCFDEFGGINVCINNAGVIHNELLVNNLLRPSQRHSIETWKSVLDINLNAVFYTSVSFVNRLIDSKQKGILINISSISAQGNAGQSAYSASKAAVEALTKTWAKELGMFDIRCACIAPGFFDTASTRQHLSDNMINKWQKAVPLGQLGKLDDLLSAVEFIITNEYFNGKVLALDGGLTI